MGENIVIYYNDSIDSDNLAAAMALERFYRNKPKTRMIWIVEPRQVALDLPGKPLGPCSDLVKKYFPARSVPLKVLLGGLLKDRDIDAIAGLTEEERKVLQLAVKPPYGPKEDAVLHNTLTAWDSAICLSEWSGAPVEMLLDVESLDEIENPVNLNFHHHEELVTRSEDELKAHAAIMAEPSNQRIHHMRAWYDGCIEQVKEKAKESGSSARPLDFESLCDTIRGAASVRFFGGSSLRILQRFIQRCVAHKIQCHLQVGSCDLSRNLFPDQFNVALNKKAAEYVFENFTEFAKFVVVPSHSAQNVKYQLLGLKEEGGDCLERRLLGFNCREDPLKIASKQVTLEKDFQRKDSHMPDLTSFLCAFIPDYKGATLGYVRVKNDAQGALLFGFESSGIPAYDLAKEVSLDKEEVERTIDSLLTVGYN